MPMWILQLGVTVVMVSVLANSNLNLMLNSVVFSTCDLFYSGKSQEGDKFIPAAPSSPLRKQEVENLR